MALLMYKDITEYTAACKADLPKKLGEAVAEVYIAVERIHQQVAAEMPLMPA